jgi:hypothetical protein
MPRTPPPPSPYPDDLPVPRHSLMLTIKLEGMPAIHLAYDRARRCAEAAVTIMDQAGVAEPWDFADVLRQATWFLINYWVEEELWPAELRSPSAGRTKGDQAS